MKEILLGSPNYPILFNSLGTFGFLFLLGYLYAVIVSVSIRIDPAIGSSLTVSCHVNDSGFRPVPAFNTKRGYCEFHFYRQTSRVWRKMHLR